jgi:cytochrome c6
LSNGFARCAVVIALVAVSAASATNGDDAGRRLFIKDATPPCALCHTLADAGASANVGPSLDELKPDAQRVIQAVKAGIGAMPAYTQLSAEQVQALARYVARASGGAK